MALFSPRDKDPHCTCLYEIENDLDRSTHCLVDCDAQRQILAQREELKRKSDIVLYVFLNFSDTPKKEPRKIYTTLSVKGKEVFVDTQPAYVNFSDSELIFTPKGLPIFWKFFALVATYSKVINPEGPEVPELYEKLKPFL